MKKLFYEMRIKCVLYFYLLNVANLPRAREERKQ